MSEQSQRVLEELTRLWVTARSERWVHHRELAERLGIAPGSAYNSLSCLYGRGYTGYQRGEDGRVCGWAPTSASDPLTAHIQPQHERDGSRRPAAHPSRRLERKAERHRRRAAQRTERKKRGS